MKKTSLRLISLVLICVLLSAMLAGCRKTAEITTSPEETAQVFDPIAYVKGGLDAVYLGEYSDEYLAMLGNETAESCAERYERGMQVSLDVFCAYFGIDLENCSESAGEQLLDLMHRMYKCAKYEVSDAQESDGVCTVKVTVSPVAAVAKAVEEDYPSFSADAANKIASGQLDKSSQSFNDWWAGSICSMVSSRLTSPEYLDAQTVTVTLEKNSAGAYAFSGTSLSDVDALIISYPA